jgi:AhpD family alkylhydroperoxidase
MKELVALGAAVASNCHICIDQHLSRCDQFRISPQDVSEAIEVGLAVREGAERAIQKHVHELLDDYPQTAD